MRLRPGPLGATRFRRAAALLLLLFGSLPLYRLLDTAGTGLAGAQTLDMARQTAAYVWSGTLLLGLAALILARFGASSLAAAARKLETVLLHPGLHLFAAVCALGALLLAWYVNQHVLSGQPNVIDAVTQLVQARYVAAGQLAGPTSELTAFWHLPLMLMTPAGWVSQYPPMHVLLLALGLRLGVVELVGPALLGVTVYIAALTWHRVFRADLVVARLGCLLLALSPFAAAHAGAFMNHTTAALFSVLAVYAGVRLRQGSGWPAAIGLGFALGALFATRPLTGVIIGTLLAGAWLIQRREGSGVPGRLALGGVAAGAAGPVLLLMLYNQHYFGSPFRFGYTAAFGPAVELGFGVDPWSNTYGLREAIGYSSSDLTGLNLFLLEWPLPLVALVGLFLLLAPHVSGALRFVAAWALLPLGANALYWHHGWHMGPRMLNEYAPAWCLLVAAAVAGLVRLAPTAAPFAPRWSPRAFAMALFAAAWLFGIAYGVPRRFASYRQEEWPPAAAAAGLPAPGLVFVHGNWSTRAAMQLAARGMRLDSVEAAMRHNSTCDIQLWLDDAAQTQPLVFEQVGEPLPQVLVARDSRIRLRPGQALAPGCLRQGRADRFGVTEVGAFLWRAGLPGLDDQPTIFARDLGPSTNRRLIRALGRPAYVLGVEPVSGRARLWPYEQAIRAIWGGAADPADAGTAAARPGSPGAT